MTDTDTRAKMGRPPIEAERQAVQIAVRLTPHAVTVLDAAPGNSRSERLRAVLAAYETMMASSPAASPNAI